MADNILSRKLVDFLVFDWLQAEALSSRPRFADHSRETMDAVIDLAGKVAENDFLPHYKAADRDEPQLTPDGVRVHPDVAKGVRTFIEAGLSAGPFDTELGGLQLPELVHAAVMANCMAANLATSAYPMLSIGNARLIAAFGTKAQIEAFATPQVEGRALGTMCLSEPQAGSSLADITTRAVADGEDALGSRYRLAGNKMWISAADHDITDDIFHLVLAKIPDAEGRLPEGTKGISLFIVPKRLPDAEGGFERNDVVVAGLNHKMGYRGTSNCLLNLGEGTTHRPGGKAGAVGWLVGEPGTGLAKMFHMMNEARIAVGLGAAAVGCRSHLLSVAYATERRQGRLPGTRGGSPVALIEHADVRRQLALQKAYAEGALAVTFYCARLVDDAHTADDETARIEAQTCLDMLTPVAKTWPSEWALAASDIAIQIHGGYGYTRDFDVEQLYRDNRLNPIHEGTTGIQGLDLVGRKIRKDKAGGLKVLLARVEASRALAEANGLADLAAPVAAAWKRIEAVAALLIARNETEAPWHATSFLSAFGHAVIGWLWLDQAARAEARVATCRCFVEFELPKVHLWLAAVEDNSAAAATFPIDHLIS
jgi:alkylation response protein AidB-like acyl-CoA dehydrogenase